MSSQPKLNASSQLREIEPAEPLLLNRTRPPYGPTFDEQSAVLHYWQILRKRRWYVLGTLAVIFGISVVVSLMSTRIYEASSKLAIYPESASAVGFKDSGNEPTASDNDLALQTQASILLSDTLALKAIDTMHLDRDPRFTGKNATGPVQTSNPAHNDGQPALLRQFQGGLKVEPVPGTRIVLVSYSNPDPRLAADIVNTLVQTFIEANVRTRYESATQTAEWLSQELADLRVKVEASEEKLVGYQKQHGILGIDEKQNIVTAKLDELNKELTAVEADRIQKESNYRFAMSEDSAGSDKAYPLEGGLLDKLLEKEADLNAQYAQLTTQFGSGYPKVAELSNQLKQLRTEIADEQARTRHRLRSDYLAAVQREKMLTIAMEQQKQEANKLNESAIEYSVLKRDADSNHQLYDSLLQKLKEAGIAAGLRSSNIRVVDVAQVPDLPVSPHLPRNLAFGFLLGLGGGIALALVLENLDTTVRNMEEAKAICTLPALGMIPLQGSLTDGYPKKVLGALPELNGNSLPLITCAQPRSPAAESFRALRTSIILSSFGTAPRVILITSSLPQEGKTTVSANAAIVMAQRGSRVLLVDGDLREPALAKMFGITGMGGLSTVIDGSHRFEDVVVPIPHVPNLHILPSGPVYSQPAELLGSSKMKECISRWRNEFDYVIVDTPPCLSFTDAVLLSREADGVILVTRWGRTTKAALRAASDLLLQVHANVIGLVLNAYDLDAAPFDRAFRSEYYQKTA